VHKYETVEQYVSAQPQPLCDVGHTLLGLLDAGLPGADATLWHGHPTWKLGDAPVCLLKAYTRHLTLGFWHGAAFSDPSGRLRPSGAREMASVKLRSVTDIDPERFGDWLRQARGLSPLTDANELARVNRATRTLER
jgi:hypothetical protein